MISILLLTQNPRSDIIADLSGIHAFMIRKYLLPIGGYVLDEKCMTTVPFQSLGEYDYCIITAICGCNKIGRHSMQILRSKIKNEIITFCENSLMKGDEDVLLHMLGPDSFGCRRVFWGADLDLLMPKKNPDKITILVDHQYYGNKASLTWKNDKSQAIINSLLEYQKKDPRVVIQQICSRKVVTIDSDRYIIPDTYRRTSIDFRQLYESYNAADIFVATHRESFGFTNVECAAAGALIAYPSPNYLDENLVSSLHSVPLGNCTNIDWANVISQIDVEKSRSMAAKYSYQNISTELDKMIKTKISILILCIGARDMARGTRIANLTTVYAYMLRKYLAKYGQYSFTFKEFTMTPKEVEDLPEFDYCIVTPPRSCTFDRPQIKALRSKIKHKMYSLCENNKIVGDEDVLFYMIGRQNVPKCIRTMWGCDFDLLKPKKVPGQINILVDHQYYGKVNSDIFARDVSQKYIDSILSNKQQHNLRAVQIGPGKVFPIENGYKIPRFVQVAGMDFRHLYQEYCKADIFMITHPGSFGFSIVESAAAGALIVTPAGYVHPKLIRYVHHCIIDPDNIDWNKVISSINVELSVNKAKQYSYTMLAESLHKDMTSSE